MGFQAKKEFQVVGQDIHYFNSGSSSFSVYVVTRRISEISNGSSSLAFMKNMKSLTVLVLRNNNISDSIPSNIGEFLNLTQLNRKITIADGSVTTVAGLGNVCLNDHISLKDVLHVPKLCTNLISVHKLTNDSQCSAIFHPTHCVFQEQDTKRMIGHAKERNGLYYLNACNKGRSVQNSALQSQQPPDPPQISPDPDLNLQTNHTLDSARPLQVYSRRKAPPPSREPVQSSPSEPQDVEVIDSSSPHVHDYDVPIALRKGITSGHFVLLPPFLLCAVFGCCFSSGCFFFLLVAVFLFSQWRLSVSSRLISLPSSSWPHLNHLPGKLQAGKEDYLTNSTKPQPDDPKFKTWNAENQMVMSWLINSMDLEIGQDFMFFATAAEIWKAAKESYSDVENTAELFEIKGALHDLKQGELSVPQYFNTLNRYWLQLDMFECPEWKCSEDAATYQKLVEKERIYKFLLGLNKSLDNIRGRILSVKPLPSLREVLSTVRHEESRRKLMLGSLADSDFVNGSALAVHGASHNPGNGQKKGRPWCDHCHRTGHVKDRCWKLHGKPSDWKSLKDKNTASGLSVSDPKESSSSAVFSKEQMVVLQKLLNQGSSHVVATGGTAEKGNFSTGLHVTSNPSRYWIVDSGASDHMTGDSGMFSSWYPYTQNYKVRIADGSLADVTGIGEVSLSDSITLKSVLFVPKLKCNLLSVAKLAHDSNCKAEFAHSSCSFQDVDSGKMIGNARVREDLYRFEMNKEVAPNKQSFAAGKIEDSLKEDRDIMVLHFRLGHPNFVYLTKLYPSLFLKKNPNEFVCHHCILAKHCRTSYPRKGVDETGAEIEDPMHCQDTPLDPHSHEKGNTAPNLAISDVFPDEILSPPIAKRKGVRSCTLRPISQFVSYEKLSPKFQAFVSNLDKEDEEYSSLHCSTKFYLLDYNFGIKCGGGPITSSKGITYEMDNATLGPATYFVTDTKRWAVSNVGLFTGRSDNIYVSNQFFGTVDTELFQTARLSASSLRYYGLGLENGDYNITLQFAEITFPDSSTTWKRLTRRVFDIYIQCQKTCCDPSLLGWKRDLLHTKSGYLWPSNFGISVVPDFIPTVSNEPPTTTDKKNRTGLIVGIVVGVGVVSFFSVAFFCIIRRRKHCVDGEEEFLGIDAKPYIFSYSELKNATSDFNPGNKLGEGGFGPVYKGTLNDGRLIAVKQLSVASHQGKNQFIAEINTISAVQHRNLVKLHGCCIEGTKRLIVYEYLENKSLDQALFGMMMVAFSSTCVNVCMRMFECLYAFAFYPSLLDGYAKIGKLSEVAMSDSCLIGASQEKERLHYYANSSTSVEFCWVFRFSFRGALAELDSPLSKVELFQGLCGGHKSLFSPIINISVGGLSLSSKSFMSHQLKPTQLELISWCKKTMIRDSHPWQRKQTLLRLDTHLNSKLIPDTSHLFSDHCRSKVSCPVTLWVCVTYSTTASAKLEYSFIAETNPDMYVIVQSQEQTHD
ncbi:Retrovirus-related Pol polyprotein from transposon TNT 1-94 [Senna tora]|uniref:non-specific serine/threonine protein kinase n=1 Tax=Senna tora TaxID=362788 RepID=A0A834X0F1_9FABA|nr:Retrovirus-related Pol polyprotein from transposon TNT 1-94 [Senna tora]